VSHLASIVMVMMRPMPAVVIMTASRLRLGIAVGVDMKDSQQEEH
jgi:hypothetical protein